MLKRNNCVYTQIVKDCSASELLFILSDCSDLGESIIYSDCWVAYDGLVDFLFCFAYNCKQKWQKHIIESNIVTMSLR